jgi:glycosyltransferase involved in cell wall biosynthesis
MPDVPPISVVMPVYNSAGVVGEAVESILRQTLRDFEFIIVDDGSSDATPQILSEYARRDSRIKLYTQENCGLIATLNRYCRIAPGKYIARMDADDISLPTRLEKQFRFLERHPEIGVLGTWIQDVDETRAPIIEWPVPADPVVVRWFLFFGNCIAHPSVMMRRDLLDRLGYYRPEAIHVEDYDLWIRAAEITMLANLPEVLVQYRISAASVSSRNELLQKERASALSSALRGTGKIAKLYETYMTKARPDRKQRAEIALDVIRRTGVGLKSMRLVPDLLSFYAVKRVCSLGGWFIKYRSWGLAVKI